MIMDSFVLRTDTCANLEEDIADLFDSVPEYIKERLLEIHNSTPPTDEEQMNTKLDCFINKEASLDLIKKIMVFHLSVCEDNIKQLAPLDIVLTTDTLLNAVLKEQGISLEKDGTHLELWYHGKKVPHSYILNKDPLLARRLGLLGVGDFCVNGFAFGMDLRNNSENYYEYLSEGPELVQRVDDVFHTTCSQTYQKKCRYYLLCFELPIEQAIFDCYSDYSSSEKAHILTRNALKILLGYYAGFVYGGTNILVRLDDSACVEIKEKQIIEK